MPCLGVFVDGGPRNRLKPARVASLLSSRVQPPPSLSPPPPPFLVCPQPSGAEHQLQAPSSAWDGLHRSLESAVSDLTARRVPALLELVWQPSREVSQ